MSRKLLSVGLDVGTTTTQMVLSQLTVENQASGFAVPNMQITDRSILYRSPVHFTPLLDQSHVDGPRLRQLVAAEYEKAGIQRSQVDTGAIIITGETSRKENAREVLGQLSGFAGDFVVATAGPDLESVLAAKGAGATAHSRQTGKSVLHMDIGGGTSNLAFIQDGQIVATGCLNVGGRLLKFDEDHKLTYISPVLEKLTDLQIGQRATEQRVEQVARLLTQGLEMAAGLRQPTELLDKLLTHEVHSPWQIPKPQVICFSGGVADCIGSSKPPFSFGDMGAALGDAIRESRLCQMEYMLGKETIRATVIGAGSHSTALSGSTVFYEHVRLPVQNIPVAVLSEKEQLSPQIIRQRMEEKDADKVVLHMSGFADPDYAHVKALAAAIYEAVGEKDVFVCLQADMAKALGHSLSLLRKAGGACLCIDGLQLSPESFLDIGTPVGPALPVVIKTMVLNQS